MGVDIAVATPPGYEPIRRGRGLEPRSRPRTAGASITLTHDPYEAVEGAHAVYTDVWFSMGDSDLERASRMATFLPYRVDRALMAHADADAVFMHCLPAHRGEEVVAEVIDGPQSIVFPQAANRLPTAQAILYALISGQLQGEAAHTRSSPSRWALYRAVEPATAVYRSGQDHGNPAFQGGEHVTAGLAVGFSPPPGGPERDKSRG